MQMRRDERPHDAVRRVLVAAAALGLTAAAGSPAFADSGQNHAKDGKAQHGQSQQHRHSETRHSETRGAAAGGHGASASHSSGSSDAASPNSDSDSSGHNPPGNNGTVFIHDVAGDHSPHNVPHVSCQFWVDFFGFDAGQEVTVSFAGQAPTGKGTALGGTWTGVISDDDASGAGNDFDHELAYTADDLGVTSLGAPQAQQGYHVKMTVATNEPGGKKSKVFWIEPCTPPATVLGGGTTAGGGVLGGGTTLGGVTGGATVGATTTAATRSGGATVLGERFTRGGASTAVAGSATGLPFTGAEIGLMTAAGLALLGGGTTLAVAARRRRHELAS